MSGTEADAGERYERNTHLAHVFAYVLIGGLLLELVNSVVWYRGWETIAGMASVLLIAVGVWGEVFFSNRARIAGDRQLAEYRARAEEAQLETERLRSHFAWRVLPPDKIAQIASKLRATPGTLILSYLQGDPECQYFAQQFCAAFRMANWSISLQSGRYGELWFGIILPGGQYAVPPDNQPDRTPLVIEALSEAGIGFNLAPIPMWSGATISTAYGRVENPSGIAGMFIGPRDPVM